MLRGRILLVAIAVAACRDPTEVTLVLSTNACDAGYAGTSIAVASRNVTSPESPVATTMNCSPDGSIGTLVVVPGAMGEGTFIVTVQADLAPGSDPGSACDVDASRCIVATREMGFIDHTRLTLPIVLDRDCEGVVCEAGTTCVQATCVSSEIVPSRCTNATQCNLDTLDASVSRTPIRDAGVDHAIADAHDATMGMKDAGHTDAGHVEAGPVATYAALDASASWSVAALESIDAGLGYSGYEGATFDGRYVYFASTDLAPARYDTTAPFSSLTSWAAFKLASLDAGVGSSNGATYDGRYVYFVPTAGIVTRYDPSLPFVNGGSWATFNTTAVTGVPNTFNGATFDGRYIYLIPGHGSSHVARYDTTATFTSVSSWVTFDTTLVSPNAKGFVGGVFDGHSLFLVPSFNASGPDGLVLRYDISLGFTSAASWASFDTTTANPSAKGFFGGAFDGRYLYLVPYSNVEVEFDGIATRYDTTLPFGSGSSWSFFDWASVNPHAGGAATAVFDGRYVYFVPYASGNMAVMYDGVVTRFDSTLPFDVGSSWSTFDLATLNVSAIGFAGGAFDGRYVYFVPQQYGIFARFDAKSPPSEPALPGYFGSFY
jgi:hypothetical protein